MDILPDVEPPAPADVGGDASFSGDTGALSRLLLGPAESERLDLRMDLVAMSWVGVLIAVAADHRLGLVFLVGGLTLAAVSSRVGHSAERR